MIRTCTKWIEKNFSKNNALIKLYRLYYKNIVKREVKLADVKSCDKILCIGGGSIPCTAIELAKQTKAKVHVIDIDNQAVECARDVVVKLGLHKKITITSGKGQEIDIEPYDVVHVALQVSPKDEVLEHLWDRSKEGDRIIVRLPKKGLKVFYSNITEAFIEKNAKYIRSFPVSYKAKTMDEILLMVKA